jgi:hypothetical protein
VEGSSSHVLLLLRLGDGKGRMVRVWIGSGDSEGGQWLEEMFLMYALFQLWVSGMGRRLRIAEPEMPLSRGSAWWFE